MVTFMITSSNASKNINNKNASLTQQSKSKLSWPKVCWTLIDLGRGKSLISAKKLICRPTVHRKCL